MAFIPDDPNNPQDKNNPQGGPPADTLTSSAPGAGPAAGAKGSAPNQTTGQPFTNLQAYLTANEPQISQQADTISGNLTNEYGQLKSGIDQGVQDFGTQVAGGYAAPNQDVVKSAAANPTAFVQDPNNVKAFQGQLNDAYTGPQSFTASDPYATTSAAVQKAASNAALVKTIPGLQTYLQNTEKNPTQGETILDTALLQGSPDAYAKVQAAAAPYAGLNDYLNTAATGADKSVLDAQATAQGAKDFATNAFTGEGGVVPTLQGKIQDQLAAAQAGANGYNSDVSQIMEALNNGTPLTPDQLAKIGLTSPMLGVQPGLDKLQTVLQKALTGGLPGVSPGMLSSFLTPGTTLGPPDAGAVTTPEQLAMENAINQLLASGVFSTTTGEPAFAVPGNAGTFDPTAATSALYDALSPDKPVSPGGLMHRNLPNYNVLLADQLMKELRPQTGGFHGGI